MSDRDRVDVQLLRQRIVQAQLDLIDTKLKEAPVELTIVCPTAEARQKLEQCGYHHVADGFFRFGEPPRREKYTTPQISVGSGWFSSVVWLCFIGALACSGFWPFFFAFLVIAMLL